MSIISLLRKVPVLKKPPTPPAVPGRLLPTLASSQPGPGFDPYEEKLGRAEGKFVRFIIISFFLAVLTPALLFLTYLGLYASPQYVAEVRLVVRSSDKSDALAEGLSMLQRFTGRDPTSSGQDGQIIISYIKSRAAIEDIGGRDKLAAMFSRDDIDYWSRLDQGASYEKILKYWQKRVSSSINTVSNILTMRVKAYSPEDARMLAQRVLDNSEILINRIADRSRKDALDRAAGEVERSAAALAEQRQALLDFRNRSGSIDPIAEVKETSTVIFNLTLQKIELEAQTASVAGAIEVGSVMERQRRGQIEVLSKKIEELKATLTSKESLDVVAEKIREFEQIKLRSQFAERIYELSKREYETARQSVERQHIFVQAIAPPSLPESWTYPQVFTDSALLFAVLLMSWGTVILIIASFVDHAS